MSLLTVEEVLQTLLDKAQPVQEFESITIGSALGRTLGEDVVSGVAVPPADNSAMDGFAVRSTEIIPGVQLPISQVIPAGSPGEALLGGSVARIFTGGQMPVGADAVLIQEDADYTDHHLLPKTQVSQGENIRPAGQDIQRGALIARSGQVLKPADLSLLASVGTSEVRVFRRLKVAILATGDELVEPSEYLKPGQIYNSNQKGLAAMLEQMGLAVVDLGIVKDSLAKTVAAFQMAAEQADVILSSGGVSVGDRDHVKSAVSELGQLSVWKLAIKPGKPLAFGQVCGKPFFGLPGNPVSTFVTFQILARPFLERMQGRILVEQITWPGQSTFEFKAGARQEYLRVRAFPGSAAVMLEQFKEQGSGVMTSLAWANALAIVAPHQRVSVGDTLPYLLIDA
ncbi:MAG: gephyrin-like molybdotransferase Glp [Pseudomonadales bacterium]